MAVEGTEPRTGFPISIEGTFGLVVEVVLALLEHLHIKEPLIIWGLFIFGLALVVHAVIRYSGTNRRRFLRMIPVALLFSLFGWWVHYRMRPEVRQKSGVDNLSRNRSRPAALIATPRNISDQGAPTKAPHQPPKKIALHTTSQPPLAQSPQVQINSAPNGIAISGGTVTNPSVINTFTDRYPHPGITPDVSFCVFQSESVGEQYQTPITIRTDTEITAPFWALFFDGPITGATIAIKDIQEPFGSSNGHPFPPGTRLDSLGTLPEKSRLLLSADAYSAVVDPDDILKIQVTEIGPPFGGPYRPWGPKDVLAVTVRSEHAVRLLAITSGYGRDFLDETMTIQCDQ